MTQIDAFMTITDIPKRIKPLIRQVIGNLQRGPIPQQLPSLLKLLGARG